MTPDTSLIVKLRPSDAHTWLECRGSCGYVARLRAEGKIIDIEEDYTNEGKQAHELAASLLNGEKVNLKSFPSEMVTVVQGYVNFVNHSFKEAATRFVEQEVNVFYSDRKGYVDAAGLWPRKVHVVDLKYGRGVSVQAIRNPQLSIYLRSLLEKHAKHITDPATEIKLTIWQPRVSGEEAERTWHTTLGELMEYTNDIQQVASEILADPHNQVFAPSDDACRFCPAAPICSHRASQLLNGFCPSEDDEALHARLDEEPTTLAPLLESTEIVAPELPLASSLTPRQLEQILKLAPGFKAWLGKVEEYAVEAILHEGLRLPNYRVVGTNPHRKWRDEAEAKAFMRRKFPIHQLVEEKLITPAKALELYNSNNAWPKTLEQLQSLIIRPRGNPTLAPLGDKRPDYQDVTPAEEFSDLTAVSDGTELL